jgi:hypothetical protein
VGERIDLMAALGETIETREVPAWIKGVAGA